MRGKKGVYAKYIKRVLDIIISLLTLILFLPIYLLIALLVRFKLGRPVIYKQQRPGKDGKIFSLYKFRSMTDARDANGNLLPDEIRLTSFGRKLRSTSLDELPEMINVLKGEMSIVGPRPLLVQYLPLYTEEQKKRHDVCPGITGYAQVNGRNAISWEERFEKDVWYVNNLSFALDFKILVKTFLVVFEREGITSGTSDTMEEFMGSNVKK